MANPTISRFVLIDDDPINNHICSKYIELLFPHADVQTFTNPQDGLDYILSSYSVRSANRTFLFLDINMPILSGWDVLEKFSDFSNEIKQRFIIYILSSSVSVEDRKRADENPLVYKFVEKPLSLEQLQSVMANF